MPVRVYGQLKKYKVKDPAKILEDIAMYVREKSNGNGHILDVDQMQELVFNSLAKKLGVQQMEIYLKD